tara:strand:- start:475 stop:618 length:144 start_codon:yes stop_codon:yes gene_type:complete
MSFSFVVDQTSMVYYLKKKESFFIFQFVAKLSATLLNFTFVQIIIEK